MTAELIHVHQFETLYLFCGLKGQPGVIWGHRGQKIHFYLKCYNSPIQDSLTIRLVHTHQLGTLCLCYGVNSQPGVIWGHGGQMLVFTTELSLNCQCNPAPTYDLHIYISFRSLIHGTGSEATRGWFGVTAKLCFYCHWNRSRNNHMIIKCSSNIQLYNIY